MSAVGHRCIVLGSVLALLAGAAGAEDKPSASVVSPLTVTAPPPSEQLKALKALPFPAVEAKAYAFVESHAALTKIEQYARWEQPICVRTLGLSAADNAHITARVRQVAVQVGAPVVAKGSCEVNVEIVFTNDPQMLLDAVADKRAILLGYHFRSQTKALTTINRPIQAWYATSTLNRVEEAVDEAMPVNRSGISDPLEWGVDPAGCAGSRLTHCLRSGLDNVLIVADGTKVAGLKLDTLADYIAVRALSQPKSLDRCDELPSITNVMDADCAGSSDTHAITFFDLAYLKALYATNIEMVGDVERSNIAGRMARIIKAANLNAR